MNFEEAIKFARETGKSIVPSRYTDASKRSYQYYFNGYGELLKQNNFSKPGYANISGAAYKDKWEESPCTQPRFYESIEVFTNKLAELEEQQKDLTEELKYALPLLEQKKELDHKVAQLRRVISDLENPYRSASYSTYKSCLQKLNDNY